MAYRLDAGNTGGSTTAFAPIEKEIAQIAQGKEGPLRKSSSANQKDVSLANGNFGKLLSDSTYDRAEPARKNVLALDRL